MKTKMKTAALVALGAVAAAALPPPAMDARLMPTAADAAALPPGWAPATAQSWQQQAQVMPAVQSQGWQQGWQQPPPVQVVHTRTVVPVPETPARFCTVLRLVGALLRPILPASVKVPVGRNVRA